MESMLRRSADFEKLYNCTGFNADLIPIEQRRHQLHGTILIALFIVFELLFLPCMVSIHSHLDNPCYKMLFFIGIIDMLVMFMVGLETGVLGIMGAVYCDYPMLIYISGAIGQLFWYAETCAELLLAINRCMELLVPWLAHTVYCGNRTWYLCSIPIVYATAMCMFTKPVLFSGVFFSWFFNPYVGYADDFGRIYHNVAHTVHDCLVIFGLSTIYVVFSGMLIYRTQKITSGGEFRPSLSQKMTFLQVVIISFFNACAALVYIYMQLARIGEGIIIFGTYAWLFAHGIPPVVYLLLNRTIRTDCIRFGKRILLNTVWVVSNHRAKAVVQPSQHVVATSRGQGKTMQRQVPLRLASVD